jgi:E3 ubiquitin-protein ligase HUWE1
MSTFRTKVAIKMSRSPGSKGKESIEGPKAESVTSYTSESEEDEEDEREETPDLYRNSALGMYGGVSLVYKSLHQKLTLFRKWRI